MSGFGDLTSVVHGVINNRCEDRLYDEAKYDKFCWNGVDFEKVFHTIV